MTSISKLTFKNFKSIAVGALACVAIVGVSIQAQAQTTAPQTQTSAPSMTPALTGVYVGGSIGSTKITDVGTKTGFGGYVGYNITPNFAVEAGAASLGTQSYSGVDIDTSNINVSVVGSFPVAPEINVFGRVGYGSLTAGVNGVSASTNSALFGGGVRVSINKNLAVRGEYTRYASDTGTFGVGLQYAF